MRLLTRTSAVVAGTAVAVLGGGAIALAAFSPVDSATGAISSCYSQKSGALRVVAPGAKCANGESPLAWAQQGVPGPSGAAGPSGAPGPAGPAGSLSCADELRILAAAPAFAVTPQCLPSPAPTASSALPTLASISPLQTSPVVGGNNVPVATVTLTAPALSDTTVAVTSGSSSVLSVSSVTVPTGQTTAAVLGNPLSAGTAILTATLGADPSKTTSVTVVNPF